jgi:proton glutamate symport protein
MSRTPVVLGALAAGAITGLALASLDPAAGIAVARWTQPIGRLWLNALQMTVVPLVLALVIVGVTTASDAAASGRTARRALLVFLLLLAGSAGFAAFAAPVFVSFLPRDASLVESLRAVGQPVAEGAAPGAADWLTGIIPSNAVAAAAQSAMLPLVVFALFFGFALTRVGLEQRARVVGLFQAIAETMVVIVRWVLWAAPLGVFALILTLCVSAGVSVLNALGYYIALQCSLYLSLTLMLYGVASLGGAESIRRFAAAILPAQVIAASTQSSLASLPAMIESAQARLHLSRDVTSLVLPMAVSLFRITSPAQYVGVATFIAWSYGIELTGAQLATGAALAVVISCGSVGLPGQVSFMTTNLPVTQAMGLPVEPLGILLVVDTIPDVFATVGNVTGDLTATTVVDRADGRRLPVDGPVGRQASSS